MKVIMSAYKRVRIFISYSLKQKILCIEAFFYLGFARLLKSRSFSKLAPVIGERSRESTFEYEALRKREIQAVASIVNLMSKYTPWESKCLVKGIAAMKMLERKGIESTLYLGTARDVNGKFVAHAWLRCGPFIITGADEMKGYTVVDKFSKKISVVKGREKNHGA